MCASIHSPTTYLFSSAAGVWAKGTVRGLRRSLNTQNDAGEFVDVYVQRKCSASNRIIGAKDHTSIQMNMAEADKVTGRFNGQFKTYTICGAIRRMSESDDSIFRLAKADGIVSKNF
ncbi:unnamed protein product [Rangifer tarandus platyrhynchus]|uniref:40S ribosomal protein S21 n=2 Tax=Rangifer tarandus platyrhynchus TaxID=3082113 RepID=A0ABN8ZND9_RANTA|nr:unnamed protein product [Rangifer tarandus platyrhynchus]CAI9706512.1 unnamed protein product [Rangifer tarandus platyrhynchus]